jgi:hypothetical protein
VALISKCDQLAQVDVTERAAEVTMMSDEFFERR